MSQSKCIVLAGNLTFHCRTSSNLTPRASTSTVSASSSVSESSDAISDMQLDDSNPPTPKPSYREIPDQEKPKTSVTKKHKQVNEFQEHVLQLVESQN